MMFFLAFSKDDSISNPMIIVCFPFRLHSRDLHHPEEYLALEAHVSLKNFIKNKFGNNEYR